MQISGQKPKTCIVSVNIALFSPQGSYQTVQLLSLAVFLLLGCFSKVKYTLCKRINSTDGSSLGEDDIDYI